jgi:MerR family transcriptional regulator/heat shock protein HspR
MPREHVAEHLAVAPAVLLRYESWGLVRSFREGPVEGYRQEDIRRLWTIVSLQRDLGINLAGVEAVLKLRVRLDEVEKRLAGLVDELREALEVQLEPDVDSNQAAPTGRQT